MNSSISKKTKLSCRWHRRVASFLSEDRLLSDVKKSRHISHCKDCQEHYEIWQELQVALHVPLTGTDELACNGIMAQIRNQGAESDGIGKEHDIGWVETKSSGALLWLGAACSLILICGVILWNLNHDAKPDGMVDSVPKPVDQKVEPSADQGDALVNHNNPLAMVAALQKEQVLLARDLDKFKTMLNERVIIFREE